MAEDVGGRSGISVRAAKKPRGPVGHLTGRERHTEPGWFEWTFRELARYFYVLGALSLVLLGPLQMQTMWMPVDAPVVMDPAYVFVIALAYVIGALFLAYYGYRFLWGEDGYVDRLVHRHFVHAAERSKASQP